MRDFLSSLSKGVSTAAKWFAGIGLVVMTAIVGMQVFARFVLNDSPAWAEQAALLLMIWYVFIAAAAGVREGFHIRISVFVNYLPAFLRHPMLLFAHVVVVLFGIAMTTYGIELTLSTWSHVIPTLGVSRGLAYMPIAISGVLITGFAIEKTLAEWRGVEVPESWS